MTGIINLSKIIVKLDFEYTNGRKFIDWWLVAKCPVVNISCMLKKS